MLKKKNNLSCAQVFEPSAQVPRMIERFLRALKHYTQAVKRNSSIRSAQVPLTSSRAFIVEFPKKLILYYFNTF